MKFVAISDTHCRHKSLKLPPADVLIHAGDCTLRGSKSEVSDFLQWFSQLPYTYKIFIAGNHDFYFERTNAKEIETILPKEIIYLNDSGVQIEGRKIWGSPITPWFFNWAFNRHRGKEIKKHWQLIPADTEILITHGPVHGILDRVVNGNHTGCIDLWHTVQQIKPKVHVCGHIHEAYGMRKKAGIQFINACQLNEMYELVNKPVTFEL